MKKFILAFLLCAAFPAYSAVTIPAASAIQSRAADGVVDICHPPCAFHFDASGTTSTVTTRPFHEVSYLWNFGDPTSGRYAYGKQQSRNFADNVIAAHVYENPGIYTWKLTARDASGVASIRTGTVVVTAWPADASTACVNVSSSDFTGCPTGATQINAAGNWPTTIGYMTGGTTCAGAPCKRVLLKRGSVQNGAANISLSISGPAMIGAYGVGVKPIIRTTSSSGNPSTNAILAMTSVINDVRFVDLDIDGQNNATSMGVNASGGSLSKILLYRTDFHDIGSAVILSIALVAAVPDSIFVVDSTIKNIIGGQGGEGIFLSAERFGIIGNHFDNSLISEHMLRMPSANRAVVANNTLENVRADKTSINLRSICTNAPDCTGGSVFRDDLGLIGEAAWTRRVVISGNVVKQNTVFAIQLVPNANHVGKVTEDVIIENNFIVKTSGDASAVAVSLIKTRKTTVRNNVISMGGSSVAIGTAEMPDTGDADIFVLNNSIFSSLTGDKILGMSTDDTLTNLVFRNNLIYAPTATTLSRGVGIPGGLPSANTIQSNNSTDGAQIITPPGPSFANTSGMMSAPTDFTPSVSGYAAAGGIAQFPAQQRDFTGCFDKTGANRIGAIVPRENAQCVGVASQ